jgi:hypothetical protein
LFAKHKRKNNQGEENMIRPNFDDLVNGDKISHHTEQNIDLPLVIGMPQMVAKLS